jgi:hypothetical protein
MSEQATQALLNEIKGIVESLEPSVPMDFMLIALERIRHWKQFILELEKTWKLKAIDWIKTNQCDIQYGTEKFYVGDRKETDCIDVRKAVEAILTACGGDFDLFCAVLSVNAIKAGEAKKVLGKEWKKHFKVTYRECLEHDQLQSVDTAFVK